MNDAPFFSIVIITYNNPSVLVECVESALALDYPAREIIVVDNASTDDTSKIVRQRFGDRVRLLVREQNSPVAARNQGFWESRGEFVLSLDHDMIIPDSRFLHRSVELFRAFPGVGLLSAKICGVENPDRPLTEHWWYPTPIEAQDRHFFTTYFPEGAAVFRADALRASGVYEEAFFHAAENLDLALKLLDLGWRILYCPSLSSIELVVSGHVSRRRTMGNYYSVRNRLWLAWIHYPLFKALVYALPRIAVACSRSLRFRWFDYFLAGLRDGVFPPPEIRNKRRPLRAGVWAEIRRIEGVAVAPPLQQDQRLGIAGPA